MSQPTALPLWSRILSAGHDAACSAAASIAYARQFAAVAISQRSPDAEVAEREVLQFEEVRTGHDGHDESDDDSVLSDASFDANLESAASRLFRTPSLRPNQRAAVRRILLDPSSLVVLLELAVFLVLVVHLVLAVLLSLVILLQLVFLLMIAVQLSLIVLLELVSLLMLPILVLLIILLELVVPS